MPGHVLCIGQKLSQDQCACQNPGSVKGLLDLQSNALPTELFRHCENGTTPQPGTDKDIAMYVSTFSWSNFQQGLSSSSHHISGELCIEDSWFRNCLLLLQVRHLQTVSTFAIGQPGNFIKKHFGPASYREPNLSTMRLWLLYMNLAIYQ